MKYLPQPSQTTLRPCTFKFQKTKKTALLTQITKNNWHEKNLKTPEEIQKFMADFKTQNKNIILITVEDKKDNMKDIKNAIPEISECKFIKDNDDGTKQYEISSNDDTEIRKKLFDILPKKDITIFELKKVESSLEDAFMVLINAKEEKNVEGGET